MNATTARRAGLRDAGAIRYTLFGVAMIGFALTGFWPQYYGRLASGAALEGHAAHLLVHLHASLFVAWLAIFTFQAALVGNGRSALHRRLGPTLAIFGYATVALGVAAGIGLAAYRVTRGKPLDDSAAFVIEPLLDMVMFGVFLTAAILWRRRSQVHKRLMVFAAYSVAFIGVVRFLAPRGLLADPVVGNALLCAPIAVFAALDFAATRRLHPVWIIGLAVFVARLMLGFLGTSEAWLRIGRALILPFV